MTPEEIRAEFIEAIARAVYEYDRTHFAPHWPTWEEDEQARDVFRQNYAHHVDALAAAGLLPVAVEFGYLGYAQDAVSRYVTEWREVA